MNAFGILAGWKLKAVLALIVVGILGGLIVWGRHDAVAGERERMAPVIASYELRIKNLLLQLDALDTKLGEANAKVDQLKADADAREKTARAALKAARTEADRFRLKAKEIAAAKPTGDQCVAARDLIVDTLGEERR